MKKITLKDLAVHHDHYCSDENYYSDHEALYYDTFSDYYEEFKDANADMNLIFRWDLYKNEECGHYTLYLFVIKQWKGVFTPITISKIYESDVMLFVKHITPYIKKLKNIWKPFKF